MNKQVELKDRKVIASKHVKLGQKTKKARLTRMSTIYFIRQSKHLAS